MIENEQEPRLFKTIFRDLGQFLSDLFSGEIFRQIKTGIRDLREYFLDQNREKRLDSMGRLRRSLYLPIWLFKSLLPRLSSYRRILLLFALYFIFTNNTQGGNSGGRVILGALIFLFIILLELKDKLLARDELEAGRKIQQAIIPDSNPLVPGWNIWLYTRPANEVGGDLVDIIKINQERYGLTVGDVAGKGLPAALLMAKLQATVRALAPDFDALDMLAGKLNAIFYRDSLPSRFASLLYMEVTAKNNFIRFVNGGHFPPLIIRENMIEEMGKGAPALGIMPDVIFSEKKVTLRNEELFFVYSDGLTEARNEQGIFFGEERLRKMLSNLYGLTAEKAGLRILQAVDQFTGKARQNDDLSMIMLRLEA
jgi:sigma-B regulation protein RsbU (phosphoserine phosphatase)